MPAGALCPRLFQIALMMPSGMMESVHACRQNVLVSELVPDEVKKELLQRIRAFLAKQQLEEQ